LDLHFSEGWSADVLSAEVASIRPGQAIAVNVILADAALDTNPVASAISRRIGILSVNIRLVGESAAIGASGALAAPIAAVCRQSQTPCHVDIVVGEGADVPSAVIEKKGALARIAQATAALQSQGLTVRWLLPLLPKLVYRLEGLVSFAHLNKAEPVVLSAQALDPDASTLAGDDRLFAWDFLTYRLLGSEVARLTRAHIDAYRDLQACLYREAGAPEAAHLWGQLDREGGYKEHPRNEAAPAATLLGPKGDQPLGPKRSELLGEKIADVLDVLGGGISGHLRAVLASSGKPGGPDPRIPDALLIGAYGGEHIGDAAILGGVLQRIHFCHGTKRAVLMTQRPNHTRHLIPMLDVPVEVEVQEYTFANIRRALQKADGVVFAGGPLTDIPKQLVRHLETVSRAKRRGLPFVMEGVGPGPFPRKPSQITARRLVQLADRITIRTQDDAHHPIMAGCKIEIGRDPAFDYLETRGAELTRLPAVEPGQIDQLLHGAKGRPLIGINVRPVGHLFTVPPAGQDAESYTRHVEARFEAELARGLTDFARESGKNPCFVFFPMNAIQFGMSDLTSAWRIMQHLKPGIDFRVWEADASLDGVVALLRRLDVVIAMRFHGVINALSQGCRVIGVDYRIGKRDKVAAVLSDAGQEENCQRIDELRGDWLKDKLLSFTQ